MPLEDEKLQRKKQLLSEQAIGLAMAGRWREAIDLNREILEEFPAEVDALNRLGRACMEVGEREPARQAYNRTLEIDPYNSIARKNLQKLEHWDEVGRPPAETEKPGLMPQQFIEEIGKSGVVSLFDLAQSSVLARIVAGDGVGLEPDGPSLRVATGDGEYLGRVEPRHAQRLVKLIEGGNRYSAAVISVSTDAVSVIIREEYQDPSQAGRLSFPSRGREEVRPAAGDHILKTEDNDTDDSGYTVIGGDEIEVLAEETGGEEEDEMIPEE